LEIIIGVRNIAREITIESGQSPKEVTAAVEASIKDGAPLQLTDDKGGVTVIPADALGYVQIGSDEPRRVGFGV